jgi:hypothetical protein
VTTNDENRIAYLAGEPVGSLSPEERAELDELRSILEAPGTWEEPDPSVEDRIVAAIAAEAQRKPALAPRKKLFRHRLAPPRPLVAVGGLAAAAVAAIVITIAVTTSGGTQPLHFAMAVSGTDLAPGAHGLASLTKESDGWRIQLSVTGLPRRDNGLYYEAWLKNAAGILVPVGTFNNARHVTLWSGVPVTQYRTLTVTQQRANGNPASSGKRVLVGTIDIHP